MAISVLEWQNGDLGKKNFEDFLMMRHLNYPDDPLYVTPNGRGSGFQILLKNKMGLGWQVEGEFYGRQNEVQEARPGQVIDDILMPYVVEFPNIPNGMEFPNIQAEEFQPLQQNPPPLLMLIQPPAVAEREPDRANRQNLDGNGQVVNMSADMNPIMNAPLEPSQNRVQDNNIVQIQPIPIEPMPLGEALPLIDEVLNENEDQNVELIFVEERNDLDQYLN